MVEVGDVPLSDMEASFGLLKGAARGDIAAQRALADQSVSLIDNRPDLDPVSLLHDGLIFARMAATQGDVHDEGRVISMLALVGDLCDELGDHDTGAVFAAEYIARIALLADQGVELADVTLGKAADNASPAIMAMAKEYERALRAQGDHLHTTFPGYFGAPALGGAKAAKVRNPLAGMPPPPAGFKLDAR